MSMRAATVYLQVVRQRRYPYELIHAELAVLDAAKGLPLRPKLRVTLPPLGRPIPLRQSELARIMSPKESDDD